jgi:L-fucose isomerase-like protein
MNLKVKPVFLGTQKGKARAILETVQEVLPPHVELVQEAFLKSWEDLPDFQEKLEGVDAILELTENIRPIPIRFYLRLGDFGLPLVLYGGDYTVAPRRLEATGYWKSKGLRVYVALKRDDLKDQFGLLAAKHRIEHTRALQIGSRINSPYVVTSSPDPKVASRALGVQIHSCESATYLRYYRATEADQVSALVKEWTAEAERIVEPTDWDLIKSARFYLAIKRLLEEYGAVAVAISCLPFVEEMQGTPCLALMRLNDEGIPAACEGDLTALMTMVFMERLANRPGFMGNIIYANPDENIIEINHCVLPLRMRGYDEPQKPYLLRDYHGRGMGACAAYEPEVGITVTVARFDSQFREMVFLKGQLVGYGEDYCRTNMRVKIPDPSAFIRQARGNHHILVYGDHTAKIKALCEEFGIGPVSIDIGA